LKLLIFVFLALSPFPAYAKIQVQGHRGARAARPENSIPAFLYAIEAGADGL
jgi:glycerophosphoryl diester phosphodiesterase